MADPSLEGASSPQAAVEAYLRAWRDGDAEAQWALMLKVDPEGAHIEHRPTNAIVERWSHADFVERFPEFKAKYFDRYILRRTHTRSMSSGRVRVHYAARRKDSLLNPHLPLWLSRSRLAIELAHMLFGLFPWYDVLSYYDVVRSGGGWRIAHWRYYKY